MYDTQNCRWPRIEHPQHNHPLTSRLKGGIPQLTITAAVAAATIAAVTAAIRLLLLLVTTTVSATVVATTTAALVALVRGLVVSSAALEATLGAAGAVKSLVNTNDTAIESGTGQISSFRHAIKHDPQVNQRMVLTPCCSSRPWRHRPRRQSQSARIRIHGCAWWRDP